MSKYDQLSEHLRSRRDTRWQASFGEIEAILGFSLPDSARRYPAWWANQTGHGHSQTHAWIDAGWRTRNLDLAARKIEFERVSQPARRPTGRIANDDTLLALAHDYTGIADRDRLMREALEALVQREAGRRLAALGGTMAEIEAPPRRRGLGG